MNWTLVEDEESDQNRNDIIKNYSGGIALNKIHGCVKCLRKRHYQVLTNVVGGDAPKDFIKIWEYERNKRTRKKVCRKYIAKVGHKWYPLEGISEYLLNQIGEELGLEMANSMLRIGHGQLRFLSEYFLKPEENLMHGAQIYSAYLNETDIHFVEEIERQNWARSLLTFQVTKNAIAFLFPLESPQIMESLVKMLLLDAITGNNDRHFYNWGVITHIEGSTPPRFSPIYDSARGLFWNTNEKTLESKYFIKKKAGIEINRVYLDKYINLSRPKIGWDGLEEINHFQLICNICQTFPEYRNICTEYLNPIYLQNVIDVLDKKFTTFYTEKRLLLVKECLKRRFQLLTEAVQNQNLSIC
ncbi:MAG: hypothetical protein DA408_07685 [Bacteroidetes bacterium]|nr:MAG: hypothetical protein C7N36_13480 [Bacteroidota bacterium]PTM13266.1 MAG: hypothetical protein DA408_07685 [Bacteroidota bacterium]